MPNGNYNVTLMLGDLQQAHDSMGIMLQGVYRGAFSTRAGEIAQVTYAVSVVDGKLTVGARPGSMLVLNALAITPTSASLVPTDQLRPQTGLHYFAFENMDNGFVIRGSTNLHPGESLNPNGVFLSPNTRYREYVYQPATGYIGVSEFSTPPSGIPLDLPKIVLGPSSSPDTDGDGLDNLAEFIVGTSPGRTHEKP
jgi:hypothetical protein